MGEDTGENPLWSSTEPYYDSFYCNVGVILPRLRIILNGRLIVGYLSHSLPALLLA